jgi:hypothetical protein
MLLLTSFYILTGAVHKSTLASLLNSTSAEKLSKDRLRRVRTQAAPQAGIEHATSIDYRREMCLFSDVAIHIKNRGRDAAFLLGRVQRMVKPSANRGKIEYKRPINLDDQQHQNIEIHLTMYKQDDDSKFIFCPGDTRVFKAYTVIMGIQLSVQEDDSFLLLESDREELKQFLQIHGRSERSTNRNSTSSGRIRQEQEQMEDDGSLVLVVEPSASSSSCRRSQRTRRVVLFDD